MWFDSWSDIARVLAVGAAAYLILVVLLRLSGKRTLAKLNAFDWIVSVAFGSTFATILLNSDVSWSEGVTALVLLAALQFVVAWTTTRLPGGRSVVTARPTLLLEDGRVFIEALEAQRLTLDELRQAVRATGSGDMSGVVPLAEELRARRFSSRVRQHVIVCGCGTKGRNAVRALRQSGHASGADRGGRSGPACRRGGQLRRSHRGRRGRRSQRRPEACMRAAGASGRGGC